MTKPEAVDAEASPLDIGEGHGRKQDAANLGELTDGNQREMHGVQGRRSMPRFRLPCNLLRLPALGLDSSLLTGNADRDRTDREAETDRQEKKQRDTPARAKAQRTDEGVRALCGHIQESLRGRLLSIVEHREASVSALYGRCALPVPANVWSMPKPPAHTVSMLNRCTEAEPVAVRISQGELSKSPDLVHGSRVNWGLGSLCCIKTSVPKCLISFIDVVYINAL